MCVECEGLAGLQFANPAAMKCAGLLTGQYMTHVGYESRVWEPGLAGLHCAAQGPGTARFAGSLRLALAAKDRDREATAWSSWS